MKKAVFFLLVVFLTSISVFAQSLERQNAFGVFPDPNNRYTALEELEYGKRLNSDFEKDHQTKLLNYPRSQAALQEFIYRVLLVAPEYALVYPYKGFIYQGEKCELESGAGGLIYMSSKCLRFFTTVDLSMFSIAHEVAHIALKHQTSIYLLSRQLVAQGFSEEEISKQLKILRKKEDREAHILALRVIMAWNLSANKILYWLSLQGMDQEELQILQREITVWKSLHPKWRDPNHWQYFSWPIH